MNTVCKEHEFIEMRFLETICRKCGQQKPRVGSNVEDEFVKYLDDVMDFNKTWLFGNEYDADQVRLLEQVKEKYLEIKKKNS